MEYAEIAQREHISEAAARDIVSRGLRRIERNGDMETFITVVRLTEFKRSKQTFIRCGSIECRPEKWVFFACR